MTWTYGESDTAAHGVFYVQFRLVIGGVAYRTIPAEWRVVESLGLETVEPGELLVVGVPEADAAWLATAQATLADPAALVDANDLGTAAYEDATAFDTVGSAAAAQAAAIQRANHTGTQLAATISDFATATQSQAAAWTQRKAPAGWTGYTLPFVIEHNGAAFRVRPDFDLRTHANITVAKEYYVDTVSGNDANAGTRNAPLKTWNAAAAKVDVDRIVLLDGSYCYRTTSTTEPTRSVEVVGEGTVYVTSDHRDICTDWSDEGSGAYSTAITGGNFVALVVDESILDANGNPTRYTSVASLAAVQAAAGTFYWTGGTLYVRPIDSRALTGNPIDGDLWLLNSLARALQADNTTYYFKNVIFRGGVRARNSSATGGLKTYFEDCTFQASNVTVLGVDEIIFRDCSVLNAPGDGVNYDARNSVVTDFAEIDCTMGDSGTATSDQASTGHSGSVGVRINGTYRNTTGQNVADVLGCKTWLLGCTASNSATGIGFNCSTTSGNMWLDGCASIDNDLYDIEVGTGCTVLHTADFSGDDFGGAGTRGTYTP
jgi:hypothetical protein